MHRGFDGNFIEWKLETVHRFPLQGSQFALVHRNPATHDTTLCWNCSIENYKNTDLSCSAPAQVAMNINQQQSLALKSISQLGNTLLNTLNNSCCTNHYNDTCLSTQDD